MTVRHAESGSNARKSEIRLSVEQVVKALEGAGVSMVPEAAGRAAAPLATPVVQRALRAVLSAVAALDRQELESVVAESSDAEVLFRLINEGYVPAKLMRDEPLARARLRGLEGRQRLLERIGETYGAVELARELGISREAVDKRRKKGKLLALDLGRHGYRYPAFQFEHSGEGLRIVNGLERVLEELEGSPLAKIHYLLTEDERLGGRTPLDLLREGKVEEVVAAAAAYGEQGAY